MYAISAALQKGGVGKTTTALCLGGAFAVQGKKVLIIDLDPQANATTSLGIEPSELQTPTVHDVLLDLNVSLASAIVTTGYGLDLVPASISLAMAEKLLVGETSRERKLYRKLVQLERESANDPARAYDYVIIDCPPSLGLLPINALAASDGVISPVQPEYYSERGLGDFLDTVNEVRQEVNEKLELLGVLITMSSNTKTNRDVVSHLREVLGDKVFKTQIARRTLLSEVAVKGPVQAYAPSSESAKEYEALALEVEEKCQKR
jgi:chromosome partitioning protein